MPQKQPSFSVVSFIRETPDVINRFVNYYDQLGAEEIILLTDGYPEGSDPTDVLVNNKLKLIPCDELFWKAQGVGTRPAALADAQNLANKSTLQNIKSDWIFFCDADEFLCSPIPICELLSQIPADEKSVRITNFEAIWGPGDDINEPFGATYMRRKFPKKLRLNKVLSNIAFGRNRELFEDGMCAHNLGKHFLRSGVKADYVGAHFSRENNQMLGFWLHNKNDPKRMIFVAHFDAISFDRWREKIRRRISGESLTCPLEKNRIRIEHRAQDARHEPEAERFSNLFKALYTLNWWQYAMYAAFGRCKRVYIFGSTEVNGNKGTAS